MDESTSEMQFSAWGVIKVLFVCVGVAGFGMAIDSLVKVNKLDSDNSSLQAMYRDSLNRITRLEGDNIALRSMVLSNYNVEKVDFSSISDSITALNNGIFMPNTGSSSNCAALVNPTTGLILSHPAKTVATVTQSFSFDRYRTAFYAAINKPNVRTKMVTDVYRLISGQIFSDISLFMGYYADPVNHVLPCPSEALTAVVFAGSGIMTMFDDYAWDTYNIRGFLANQGEVIGNAQNVTVGNPYNVQAYTATTFPLPVSVLMNAGAQFVLCNGGTAKYVSRLTAFLGFPASSAPVIYDDLMAHLIPGVMVVPLGATGVQEYQRFGWTYFQESVNTV